MSEKFQEQRVGSEQEVFGPYVVHERLGVGGMATVHRAKERGIEGFERIVALKRLLPHLAEDASFVKSFVREAKFASMLQHANIVQLYELGRVGSTYYISMEHIDGRDVRRILTQARKASGPPPVNVTLSLLIQLCDALEYAHARCDENGAPLGLVHRDVSPSNLLVTKTGHLKVIDFGIAKAQSAQLHTQDGKVKGKLAYMAPEAITGKDVDARSDIFSAGVIAHELLTARTLFASKSEFQTLINVQRADVQPPSAFNHAVPAELDAIVAKALARDPAERYASAGQMRDDLHGVRIRYQMSATNREVEEWCAWAFGLDSSSRSFSSSLPAASPIVGTKDDDEAAQIAWGGANDGAAAVVHELPDRGSQSRSVSLPRAMSSVEAPAFGDSLVAPRKGGAVAQLAALGAAVALLGVGGFLLLGRGGSKAAASSVARAEAVPAVEAMASLKFIVEPMDATVKIAGMPPHVGMPWKVDLDPGVVQIKVSRDGHQSWETSVELSSGEQQTIRVALAEAVGDPNLATLEIGSQPAGLEIVLDGKDTGQKTPWKTQLPAGAHTVQLRDATGVVSWKHTWNAEARTLYEFKPSMDASKQKERVERERLAATGRPPAQRAVAAPSSGSGRASAFEAMIDAGSAPVETAPAPAPAPAAAAPAMIAERKAEPVPAATPTKPAPARVAAAIPAPATATAPTKAAPRAAVVVPPNAVKRTSGSLPTLKTVVRPGMQVPKSLAAKICIGENGAVTSVQVLKVTGELAQAFASSIRSWRYTPYKQGGVATPACFVNSFQLQ
jgi:serine/threonine protein kinase